MCLFSNFPPTGEIVPFLWSMLSTGILLYLFAVYTSSTRDFLPAVYLFKLYNSSSENLCSFSANSLPLGKLYLSCGQCSPQEFFYTFSVSIPPPQEISFRLRTFSIFITLPVRIYVSSQQFFSHRGNCSFPMVNALHRNSFIHFRCLYLPHKRFSSGCVPFQAFNIFQ